MIAMALTCDPKLIFADEPTTALDVTVQAQIMKLFKEIQEKFKTAIVLISHDLGVISTQCDEIVVMYAGQVMERGTPQDIFEDPKHPYTLALKRSIPDLYPEADEAKTLYTIPGLPPNLMKLGDGCPFAPRCESAEDSCRKGIIPNIYVKENHEARCSLLKDN